MMSEGWFKGCGVEFQEPTIYSRLPCNLSFRKLLTTPTISSFAKFPRSFLLRMIFIHLPIEFTKLEVKCHFVSCSLSLTISMELQVKVHYHTHSRRCAQKTSCMLFHIIMFTHRANLIYFVIFPLSSHFAVCPFRIYKLYCVYALRL